MQTKIIYEDSQILVCHKPAGLATQSAKIGQPDMVSELKKYLAAEQNGTACGAAKRPNPGKTGKISAEPYLGVVHRLDQPVEGLLVFGKTKEATAKLTAQLSKGTLNKQYYAVVCGKPATESGELVDYLIKDGNVAKVSETANTNTEAKKAILQYKMLDTGTVEGGESISVLDIHIDTGRFHQIRVQLAHAGMPILGDSKYGNEKSMNLSRQSGIRNVALYAYQLKFTHPVTGKKLEFFIEPGIIRS